MTMTISELCKRCINKCKQPNFANIISCPHFAKEPKQLELKLGKK